MKKKITGIIMILLLLLAVGSAFAVKSKADFGDFNDYDSGSDWDSSDWGSSDWDSDWDSDWGSSDWSSSSYSSSGSSGGGGPISDCFSVTIVLLVIAAFIWASFSGKKNNGHTTYTPPQTTPYKPATKALPYRNTEISDIIKEHDPNFTTDDFLAFVGQVYMDLQTAWMNRDLEPVRAVMHQNLYQQTEQQIQMKIQQGIINYLERITVNTSYLTSYRSDKEYEYVSVYLASQLIDYQVKEATGEVVSGNKKDRWTMYYKLTFVRTMGSKTRSAEEKDRGWVCPNCGAPLKGTSFGKCEYCDSVVTTGNYDWVITGFNAVKGDTIDEGIVRSEK